LIWLVECGQFAGLNGVAADDAEFLRRVWLDFDGGIPTAAEARAFLADKSPDKRARLIERLMSAPRFAVRVPCHADGASW